MGYKKVPSCPWALGFQLAFMRPLNELNYIPKHPVVPKTDIWQHSIKMKEQKFNVARVGNYVHMYSYWNSENWSMTVKYQNSGVEMEYC